MNQIENGFGMHQAVGGTAWTLEQTREANTVNEITGITNGVGPVWSVPAYDPAGNMRTIPKPDDPTQSFTGNWDAWNRLVKLVDDETSDSVSEYQYDALKRRIVKLLYVSGDLDETRHIYLSGQNQVLEERINSSTDAAQQNIWGLMYIDGLVLRDRTTTDPLDERLYCYQDANWNAVALADPPGTIVERFTYDPFGASYVLAADFTATADAYAWTTRFTGRELDLESLLYHFRARYLHFSLGVFISWDPLGYADGSSLYAAYFVPRTVDFTGLKCFNPCTPNGCGAKKDLIKLVPNAPVPTIDFKPCCDDHDICYCICGIEKSSCDDAFLSCMKSLCATAPLVLQPGCHAWANAYFKAVSRFGGKPFKGGQNEGCANCDCPKLPIV